MTNIQSGRTRSDELHRVRIGLRADIDRVVAVGMSRGLAPEDVMGVIVESAAAHFALVSTPEEAAYEVGRVARRIRAGDRVEL